MAAPQVSGMLSLAFHPSGKELAAGSSDGRLHIWEVATGRLNRSAALETMPVSIAFDPTGDALVVGGASRLELVSLSGPAPTPAFSGHSRAVSDLAFAPDGKRLVSSGGDELRLWDVASGKLLGVLGGHDGHVTALSFGPAGLVASGGTDRTVRIWHGTGRALQTLVGHTGSVLAVELSPDGKHVASGGEDKRVRVWDVASGEPLHRFEQGADAYSLGYSSDGKLLAVGGLDGEIAIWDIAAARKKQKLRGHTALVSALAFSSDGHHLASGSLDKTLRWWDLRTGQAKTAGEHLGRLNSLALSPDEARIATAGAVDGGKIWSLRGAAPWPIPLPPSAAIQVAFSPAGSLLATAGSNGEVSLLQAATGRRFWRAPAMLRSADGSPGRWLLTHKGWTELEAGTRPEIFAPKAAAAIARTSVVVSQALTKPSLLCMLTDERRVDLWDIGQDKLLQQQSARNVDILAVAAGCLLRGRGPSGGRVRLLSETGVRTLSVRRATAVGFDVRARQILVASDNAVLRFDASGKELGRHKADPGVTALQQVGGKLVLGFATGKLVLHGDEHTVMAQVPRSPVRRLSAGPSGTLLAGFDNGVVGMWSMSDGALLAQARLPGRIMHLQGAANTFFAASELGHLLVWDLSLFEQSYCEALRGMWAAVPVVWRSGRLNVAKPPAKHLCQRR